MVPASELEVRPSAKGYRQPALCRDKDDNEMDFAFRQRMRALEGRLHFAEHAGGFH